MAKPKFLTESDGTKVYPISHADAIYTSDGEILGDVLSNIKSNIGSGSEVRVTFTDELAGDSITFSINSVEKNKTVPTESPYIIRFNTDELGTLTITDTNIGATSTVEITTYTLYEVEFAVGFNYRTWIDKGGVTKSFSTLADILADQKTVRQLFTMHDAVDYLVSQSNDTANMTTILNAYYVEKWVNLRDYALDTLSADASIKAIMDTVGMYGYGEVTKDTDEKVILKGLVPVMTSKTAPYGTMITSSDDSRGASPWDIFDLTRTNEDYSNSWMSSSATNQYVSYKFTNPVNVKKIFLKTYTASGTTAFSIDSYYIQYSNDNSTWTNATETLTYTDADGENIEINTDQYALYWRVYITSAGAGLYAGLSKLQFYGRTLSVSVPTMTSNTAPWGEVSASGQASTSYPYWYAFSNCTTSDGWIPNGTSGWIQYKFPHETVVKFFQEKNYKSSGAVTTNSPSTVTIQGSNDGNSWVTLAENISILGTSGYQISTPITNTKAYSYYRINTVSTGTLSPWLGGLNLYGLDYSERELDSESNVKFIYDHGVEVESIYCCRGTITKNESTIKLISSSSTACTLGSENAIDLTNYSMLRAIVPESSLTSGNTSQYLIVIQDWSTLTTKCYSALQTLPFLNYLDISSLNAEYIPAIQNVKGETLEFSELWIE